MEFPTSVPTASAWVKALRWVLLVVATLVIYLLGAALATNGDYVQSAVARRGEVAASNLEAGAEALLAMRADEAATNFRLAGRNFDAASDYLASLGQGHILMAGLPYTQSQLLQSQLLLTSGSHLAKSGEQISLAMQPLVRYWDGASTLDGRLEDMGAVVGQILIDNASTIALAIAEAEEASRLLDRVDPSLVTSAYAEVVAQAQAKTTELHTALDLLGGLAQKLPQALGFGSPRYYLMLNQNPNEIRPTGGFIGSYAVVELYQGKIGNLYADNIYNLDGNNPYSDLELPDPLKAITTHYGVRDANWDPDFPTTARTIQHLYEESGGGTVDGVVAITPAIIEDLLAILGSVEMSEYGVTLTSANFAELVQKNIAENDKTPYDHKQLIVDFTPKLLARLMSADAEQLNRMGEQLLKRLLTKDVLVSFTDQDLSAAVRALGWSGQVLASGPQEDYALVVDANLGGNKSSASIVRHIDHRAVIQSDGSIRDTLTVTYDHQGGEVFPDGTNKNYVRVYLPAGVRVEAVSGYDEGTQVSQDAHSDKTVVGLWVTTPPQSQSVIKLTYDLPVRLNFVEGVGTYRLIAQKQPGSTRTLFTSQLQVHQDMSLIKASDQSLTTLFADPLIKDEMLSAQVFRR